MNKILILGFAMSLLSLRASATTAVSVTSFQNKVGSVSCGQDWDWWQDHLGTAFQEMLITELVKNKNFEVLEREGIGAIYDQEVNLPNSEDDKSIKKNKFKKAKYTFMGAVTSYEYCAEKTKGGVSLGTVARFLGSSVAAEELLPDVNVGSSTAKVVIDLRMIETATGRIVKSIRAEGSAKRSNFKIAGSIGTFADASETPVGEAARNAVESAATKF